MDLDLTEESIKKNIDFVYKVIKVLAIYIQREGTTDYTFIGISEMMLAENNDCLEVRYSYLDDVNNTVISEERFPLKFLNMKGSQIRQELGIEEKK